MSLAAAVCDARRSFWWATGSKWRGAGMTLMDNNPEEEESGGWRRREKGGSKKKSTECGCGCTYRRIDTRKPTVVLSILGNPSGIFSRREEDLHSDKEKDQDLTEGQDAINSSAAWIQECVSNSGALIIVFCSWSHSAPPTPPHPTLLSVPRHITARWRHGDVRSHGDQILIIIRYQKTLLGAKMQTSTQPWATRQDYHYRYRHNIWGGAFVIILKYYDLAAAHGMREDNICPQRV